MCECGGIGRRARLRTVWATLQVQILSLAPIFFKGAKMRNFTAVNMNMMMAMQMSMDMCNFNVK